MPSSDRRTFLGTGVAIGLSSLAGFGQLRSRDADSAPAENESTDGADLDAWLADANDPRTPQIRDLRYGDAPTVYLGVSNTDSFSPPAIKVAPETTVTWEWTDGDGAYNVVAADGTFDSGPPVSAAETTTETFEHVFESAGAHRYVSEPQADAGMKGVVVVESAPSSGYPTVDEWLVETDGYDGTIADRTGTELVEITNGASGNGGSFAFDPHAVKVSAGTTVRWSWTGRGGAHNLVFEDADIGSETIHADSGVHYEETFTDPGVFRYACQPHRALGHRGAIVVE